MPGRQAHKSATRVSTPLTIAEASCAVYVAHSPWAALLPISAQAVICFCLTMLYAPALDRSAFIRSSLPSGTLSAEDDPDWFCWLPCRQTLANFLARQAGTWVLDNARKPIKKGRGRHASRRMHLIEHP